MNLVFETEIMLLTFIVILIEVFLLSFLIMSCIGRPNDLSRKRFLYLTLYFLSFNIFGGLFPDKNLIAPMFVQYVFVYGSAIAMASYYFVFLSKEFDFNFSGFFNAKLLAVSLSLSFILTYIIGFWITGNHKTAYYSFIGFPIVIAIFYCYMSILEFKKTRKAFEENTPFKSMYYAGFIGVLLIAILPIESVLGGHQGVEVITVNSSYFLMAFAYLKRYIFIEKMDYLLIEKNSNLTNENPMDDLNKLLSSREKEVAFLMLKNLTHSQIASDMFIEEKTVSKHASNIYKKVGLSGNGKKNQFIQKYGSNNK